MALDSFDENILSNNTYKFRITNETSFVFKGDKGETPVSGEWFNDKMVPSIIITIVDGKVSKVSGSS